MKVVRAVEWCRVHGGGGDSRTAECLKQEVIFDCFISLCRLYTFLYVATTLSISCLNFIHVAKKWLTSTMNDQVICHLRVFLQAISWGLSITMSESSPFGSQSAVICSRPSSVNSAVLESRTSWMSFSSKCGDPLEIIWAKMRVLIILSCWLVNPGSYYLYQTEAYLCTHSQPWTSAHLWILHIFYPVGTLCGFKHWLVLIKVTSLASKIL